MNSSTWTRREWLAGNTAVWAASALPSFARPRPHVVRQGGSSTLVHDAALQSQPGDLDAWRVIARRAIEAATAAGAQYADARLTRTSRQNYMFQINQNNPLMGVTEHFGVGVRALVDGYWGFCAEPHVDGEGATRVAQQAVAQAKTNAKGPSRTVEMGRVPVVSGTWSTPIEIDPFAMSIEEKWDALAYWYALSVDVNRPINTLLSGAQRIQRQERVTATSDGSLVAQTLYETGGQIVFDAGMPQILHISSRAGGWEVFENADIPGQMRGIWARTKAALEIQSTAKPMQIGRHTIVCDGATMAAMIDATFGVATQLDRAMGYEANAGGTSFIDDPLNMVGSLQVAAPNVTVTGNRTAPGQLGTVKWDDECVEPKSFTIIKDGVLNDFQTTREQANWIAPYYQKKGIPVQSNGCADSETGLEFPLQRIPNLAMTPRGTASLDDLIATVPNGLLVTGATATADFQGRSGIMQGTLREIKNGRLARLWNGGAVFFNTRDFWNNISIVGGPDSQDTVQWSSQGGGTFDAGFGTPDGRLFKGEPSQKSGHAATAPAGVIPNQAVIDPTRRHS